MRKNSGSGGRKTYKLRSGEKAGLKASLQYVIDQNAGKRISKGRQGLPCSFKTREERANTLFLCFDELDELGFHLKDAHSFKLRHAIALGRKWEGAKLAPATIANRLSLLSIFCRWIGKPGMMNPIEQCVNNPDSIRRSYVARHDKSWSGSGVDSRSVIDEIRKLDAFVANQLLAMESFGLRRKEALLLRPAKCFDKDSKSLQIVEGTKGGRPRTIKLDTDRKLAAINKLIEAVDDRGDSLISPKYEKGANGLRRAIRRFNYVMGCFGLTKAELGVTSHGLRHQCLIDDFERRSGVASPVRGGSPACILDEETLSKERLRIAEEAGHSRIKITSAYLGAIKK